MIITTTNGKRYRLECEGGSNALMLYDSDKFLGDVTEIDVNVNKRLQIYFKHKGRDYGIPVTQIKRVKGTIKVKTSDYPISFFAKNDKIFVKLGHREVILIKLSSINLGQSLSIVYSEAHKICSFHSTHVVEELTST